jgi:hypothetical protein
LDSNYEVENLKEIVDCISTINTKEKCELLHLLKKYEHLFDGTLGNWETSDIKFNLKEDANPYHGKAFLVTKKSS